MTRSIRQIDQAIDANRFLLLKRRSLRPISAADWQAAWDSNPDLQAREQALYQERGEAQLVRDAKAEREYRAECRRHRAAIRRAA